MENQNNPVGTIYEDGSVEGQETQVMDLVEPAAELPLDRCVHIAEGSYYCVEASVNDHVVNEVTPVLGYWSQYLMGGFHENGWAVYFLTEVQEYLFRNVTWMMEVWAAAQAIS